MVVASAVTCLVSLSEDLKLAPILEFDLSAAPIINKSDPLEIHAVYFEELRSSLAGETAVGYLANSPNIVDYCRLQYTMAPTVLVQLQDIPEIVEPPPASPPITEYLIHHVFPLL